MFKIHSLWNLPAVLRARFRQKRKAAMHVWESEIGSDLLGTREKRKHCNKKLSRKPKQTQPKKPTKQNQQQQQRKQNRSNQPATQPKTTLKKPQTKKKPTNQTKKPEAKQKTSTKICSKNPKKKIPYKQRESVQEGNKHFR